MTVQTINLGKSYGKCAPWTPVLQPSLTQKGRHRISGTERIRQVDDDAADARTGQRRRSNVVRRRADQGLPWPKSSAPIWTLSFHPTRTARNHLVDAGRGPVAPPMPGG